MRKRKTFNPKRRIRANVEKAWIEQLSMKIAYGKGNPEHKRGKHSPDIEHLGVRPYKSQCQEANIHELSVSQELLLEGVKQGLVSEQTRDIFPQNVWAVTSEGVPLEGQLENQGQGIYHGYPMPLIDPLTREVLKRWKKK